MGSLIYKFMERIDGEKGIRFIPYKLAERIKVFCLTYLIKD